MNAPSTSRRWNDLGIRIASAIVLIPLVLVCNWLGGFWFLLFIILLGIFIALEWTNLVHGRDQVQFVLHAGAALAGAILPESFGVVPAVAAITGLALASALKYRMAGAPKGMWGYIGVYYAGLPVMALAVLRSDELYGMLSVLWLFLIVWAADIGAYFAGRMIGGPKLAPAISPNKTWAGLGGAIGASVVASASVALLAGLESVAVLALLAGALAIVEQGGDLFESALKRHCGVKDSGNLIPGHGGAIDRIDGLIAVSVAALVIGMAHVGGKFAAQGLLIW